VTKYLVVLGAGGFAREMYWHIQGAYPGARVVFVDDVPEGEKEIAIGGKVIPVVKDWDVDAISLDGESAGAARFQEFVLGVGDPQTKKHLVEKARASGLKPAPTVVHPLALIQDPGCRIGVGGVITPGCVLTTNVTLGDFVLLNLNTTIGHDAVLGDYVTVNPGCQISGNVTIGEGASLGTGTVTREKVTIAPGVITGAQACIVKDIDEPNVTVMGVPAKKKKA